MSNSNPEHERMRCDLHRLERNNYFTGKLLTPRDFITEQAYHAGTQRTTARTVLGEGSVCGLRVEPTLHPAEGEAERVDVTVTEGLAIDGCGRLVVVDEAVTEPFDLPVVADGAPVNDISVYITWRECAIESVPRTGMENACETECAPNRMVEYGEVTVVPGPADATAGAVGGIDFPDRETVLGIRRFGSDDVGVALDAIPVVLPPVVDATIAGTTTAAEETDVSVDLTFPDGETTEHTATVAADGTFAVTVDASGHDAITRFTAEINVKGTVLEVPGVVGDQVDEPFVADPTVLFDAAQSYYEANRGECSFADGPVLLGTLHKEEGQSWDQAVFERGPIVYGNKLLYAAVVSHAADFDNPHQVSLALDAVDVMEGGISEPITGESALLHSGDEYIQGTTLEASVGDWNVDTFELRTVQSDRPGTFVTEIMGVNGMLRIDTSDLSARPYVVTAEGTDRVVVFDDGEGAEIVPADRTPEALFTIVIAPSEPVETSRTRVSVAGFDAPGGDVFLTSTDGSVSITPHLGTRTVDFTTAGGGGLTADQRLYLRERSLLNAAWSFQSAGLDGAMIASLGGYQLPLTSQLLPAFVLVRYEMVRALDNEEHATAAGFLDIFTRPIQFGVVSTAAMEPMTLVDLEERIGTFIHDNIDEPANALGLSVYIEAVNELRTAVDAQLSDVDSKALAVATAQDRVAEAVKLLLGSILNLQNWIPGTRMPSTTGYVSRREAAIGGGVYNAYIEAIDRYAEMPDVVGLSREEAELHFRLRSLEPSISLRSVEDTTELSGIGVNDVNKQSPEPGETIQPGTEVVLEVFETPGADAINGIGDTYAADLKTADIVDVYDVSTAPIEVLMEATGVTKEEEVRTWKADATRLLQGYRLTRHEGIDTEVATALTRSLNLTSGEELAVADAEVLVSAVNKAHEEGRISGEAVTVVENMDWATTLETVRKSVEADALMRGDFGFMSGAGIGF
jgi:hypothetical protein